jgi:hypothetical protein
MPVPPQLAEDFPDSPARRDLSAEPRLRDRFEEAWAARCDRNFELVYQLSDPRDHADVPFEQFEEAVSVADYSDVQIIWLQVIEQQGRVRVKFNAKRRDPNLTKLPPQEIVALEDWIKVDGQWYRDLIRQ